jgi:hypothetical protein
LLKGDAAQLGFHFDNFLGADDQIAVTKHFPSIVFGFMVTCLRAIGFGKGFD